MTNTIRREIRFPQSREAVWHALADRAMLAAEYGWTMMHAKLTKVLGGKGRPQSP
jgi:hypothetical protein